MFNIIDQRTNMTEPGIEKTILEADPKHTSHLLKSLLDQSMCPICQDHMFVPFMTKCGHNFCYECLSSWLCNNLTCPACRAPVDDIPYFNVFAQSMLEGVMEVAGRLLNADAVEANVDSNDNDVNNMNAESIFARLPELIRRDRDLKIKQYKRDLNSNNLFKKIFENRKLSTAIVDASDDVERCPNCLWEVEGDRCPNCHINLGYSAWSDEDDPDDSSFEHVGSLPRSYLSEDDLDSEIDGYLVRAVEENEDSDDSFIDNRAIDDLEVDAEEDLLSSASSSPVRRPNAYFPTMLEDDAWATGLDSDDDQDPEDLESWNGFHDEADRVLGTSREAPAEVSDHDSNDAPNVAGSDDSDFSSSFRRRGRNTITISDDEDDDDDDDNNSNDGK